jgi:beta-lactamase class A
VPEKLLRVVGFHFASLEDHLKGNKTWLSLLVLVLLYSPRGSAQAPAAQEIKNTALEYRLKTALAKTSGIWGVGVKHIERNEFTGINPDERFQMASVFKVPVLVELFHQVKEGKISLDERLEWHDAQLYFGSGILVTLDPGLRPTVRDLATLMIIVSDNAATDILCKRLGFDQINARMRALGLVKTSVDVGTRDLILQALGLPGEAYRNLTTEALEKLDRKKISAEVQHNQEEFLRKCPNCGTPREITSLMEKLVTGQLTDKEPTAQMLRMLSQQQFNERLPRWLSYDVRVDHKTGTLLAPVWVTNDAGIIYLPNRERLIICVFSRGTETGQSEAQIKAAISNAEGVIGEIGKIAFDYYTSMEASKHD